MTLGVCSIESANTNSKCVNVDMLDEYSQLLNDLEVTRKSIMAMIQSVKHLQKKSKKNKKPTNIKSGFLKPVKVTEQLAVIVGIQNDELIARSVVNKKINEYIKLHNLQVESNKQTFVLDEGLADLFGLDIGCVVHYFKMQTFLKNHYPKD